MTSPPLYDFIPHHDIMVKLIKRAEAIIKEDKKQKLKQNKNPW